MNNVAHPLWANQRKQWEGSFPKVFSKSDQWYLRNYIWQTDKHMNKQTDGRRLIRGSAHFIMRTKICSRLNSMWKQASGHHYTVQFGHSADIYSKWWTTNEQIGLQYLLVKSSKPLAESLEKLKYPILQPNWLGDCGVVKFLTTASTYGLLAVWDQTSPQKAPSWLPKKGGCFKK